MSGEVLHCTCAQRDLPAKRASTLFVRQIGGARANSRHLLSACLAYGFAASPVCCAELRRTLGISLATAWPQLDSEPLMAGQSKSPREVPVTTRRRTRRHNDVWCGSASGRRRKRVCGVSRAVCGRKVGRSSAKQLVTPNFFKGSGFKVQHGDG